MEQNKSFFERNAITVKGLTVVFLTLLLLIPATMIQGLVRDRENRQAEATAEVGSKWGGTQTIIGPVISIPYIDSSVPMRNGQTGVVQPYSSEKLKYIHFLPNQLSVNGKMNPEKRHRGIFEIVVYQSALVLTGKFGEMPLEATNIPRENFLTEKAFMSLGISDLRGIEDQIQLKWNQQNLIFNPGISNEEVMTSGVSVPIPLNNTDAASYDFSLSLNLKGSQYLHFAPVGKETNVHIASAWENPSFDGAFLPDTHTVSKTGFEANWKVLHLNRNFPQSWIGNKYRLEDNAFGVNLLQPVNSYSKIYRTVNYAILFIGLTFLLFFFIELISGKAIHPFQYTLVGLALCIFYALLLSISEQIPFNWAYMIATSMTMGLIIWYTNSILGEARLALLVGGTLTVIYTFIFTIIQLQDYALLMGSLGLFLTLAVIMYFSRKIDWEQLGKR